MMAARSDRARAGTTTVARASRPRPEAPVKHADVIAFANQKGGVAKTTTTLNLAVAFAESGYRVLCIDLDPQGNLTMSQGIDPDKVEKSLYDVLVNDMPISEIIVKREIDIAVASIDLAGAEIAMSTKIGRERSLEKALKEVSGDYDFVCIDTPPSLGLLTINALTAANKVIVPVQCEYLSMRGLVQLQNTLKMIQENLNPDVRIEGILPTMLDTRTVHAKEAVEILEENFGDLVFKSRIRKAIKFAEAPVKGASVLKYDSEQQRRELLPGAGEGGPGEWLGVSGQACARVPSPISSARLPRTPRPIRPRRRGTAARIRPRPRSAEATSRAADAAAEDAVAERAKACRADAASDARRARRPLDRADGASCAETPPGAPQAGLLRGAAAARASDRADRREPALRARGAGLRAARQRRAAPAGDPGRRRRRRRRQRRQPHGRGPHPRGRVHGRQHRSSVAAALRRRRHRPHRRRADARPRRRRRPRGRPPLRLRGAGQDQAPAQGLRHGLRRRRRRRRHRHRRRPGRRPPRPRGRRADRRHRHQAVQLRGQPPRQPGRTRGSRSSPPRSTP